MRVLRSTLWPNVSEPGPTTVIRDCDARDSLDGGRLQLHIPGAFVALAIFEMEDADIDVAVIRAMELRDHEQEAHQAMLYYWSVATWGSVRRPGGVLFMDKPAPLSREEIAEVFEQLAEHPDYRGIRIVSHTRDGEPVELREGKVQP